MSALALEVAPKRYAMDRSNIPILLQGLKRWVVWRAEPRKEVDKIDKVPIDAKTGRPTNALNPLNWLTFANACRIYDDGLCSGIGIALSDQPIIKVDGNLLFLTALDFDHCENRLDEIDKLRIRLGRPYYEISPSGEGIRMFALSKECIKGGNAGGGRELYGSGRFMTVTGTAGRGNVIDATEELVRLDLCGRRCERAEFWPASNC